MEHPATLTFGTDEALGCSVFEKEFGTNSLAISQPHNFVIPVLSVHNMIFI